MAIPGGASQYPDNIIELDLSSNKMTYHDYGETFRTVATDFYNRRLLAGDNSGYVWTWHNQDYATDNGSDIAWELQTADFNELRKYFPRYVRYDVGVITGSAAGYVIMDDVSKQTHTLLGDRLTRKRLVTGCTGDRLAVRLSGSGSVDIYGLEIE